ncbi:MAG: ATP-binding protein [Pseudomonadales bacterium]|jgi:signal transduction histidine kinase|nr:ATP-binding protein [Pseudomonadales bacterium]
MIPQNDQADTDRPALLTRLLPSLPKALAGDAAARRDVALAIASFVTAPMLLYLAWASLAFGMPLVSGLALLSSVIVAVLFFVVRRHSAVGIARAALLSVLALQLTAAATAGGQFSLVWVMLIPLVTIFFFGRREGVAWSLAVLAAFTLLLTRPRLFLADPTVSGWPLPGAIEDFVLAYVLTLLLATAWETLRIGSMEHARDALLERARSEERQRDFTEIGTDLLFELDAELRVTFLTGGWRALTGIPEEAVLGLTFMENAEGYTRSGWAPVAEKLAERQPVRDEIVNFHMDDGRELFVLVRADPSFGADGTFLGYRGVGVDETRRLLAERQLREKDRALQHATRMDAVGQLTSGVAHDFNNLLTVILGNLELLRLRLEESEIDQEELDQVAGAARRAADLTSKLLAFSSRQALRPQRLDIMALLAEARALFARTLPENIQVHLEGAEAVAPCRVDRTQLESALLNLALNARDAMPEGGTLVLSATNLHLTGDEAAAAELDAGDYVAIRVKDSGTGMDAELLDHVFEPFFTTKPSGRGTGLGLSMVYGFLRQSGGTVRLESTAGEGTTVELLLPAAADAAAADAPRPEDTGDHDGQGRRALVVEDEPGVRGLVANMLGHLGYSVETAAGGEEAVAAFAARPFDLVISDVVLGGTMDGLAVLAAIREQAPSIPAIVMSGYSDALFRANGERPQGVPLLAKPFGLATLRSTLASLSRAP